MESERRIKRRKKKIKRNMIIIAVIAVSIIGYFLANNQFVKGLYYKADSSVSDTNSVIEFEEGITAKYTVFDDLIISYSKNGISAYDISAQKVNTNFFDEISLDVAGYNNIMINSSDKYLLAYDKGGREFIVFNKKKIIQNIKLNSSIILAKPLNNGGAVIVAEDISAKNQVIVLDNNGKEEFIWHSGVNNIVDASYSYKKGVLTVVTADLSTGSFNSKLKFFNISSATAFSEITLDGVFVTNVNYFNDTTALAISDSGLYYLGVDGTIKNEYSFNEKMLANYSLMNNGAIALAFRSSSNETTTEIVNKKGKVKGSFVSDDEIVFLDSFNSNVILCEKREINIITKSGFLLRNISYNKDLNKAFFIGKSKIVLVGNSEIRILN